MTKLTAAQLQKRLEELERRLGRVPSARVPAKQPTDPRDRADYVAHGSDKHAAFIGLKRTDDEADPYAVDGWTLEDPTQFGPGANDQYIIRVTRQKVSELTSPMPTPQSKDPRKPHFAPVLWTPDIPFSQITE
jgi:hypothetical protein